MPIIIGLLGGAGAMYVYLKSQTAPTTQTVSLTTRTLPANAQPAA